MALPVAPEHWESRRDARCSGGLSGELQRLHTSRADVAAMNSHHDRTDVAVNSEIEPGRPTEHFNLLEADTPDLRDGCRQSAREARLQAPQTAPSVVHKTQPTERVEVQERVPPNA
jgi:hypothetical protein